MRRASAKEGMQRGGDAHIDCARCLGAVRKCCDCSKCANGARHHVASGQVMCVRLPAGGSGIAQGRKAQAEKRREGLVGASLRCLWQCLLEVWPAKRHCNWLFRVVFLTGYFPIACSTDFFRSQCQPARPCKGFARGLWQGGCQGEASSAAVLPGRGSFLGRGWMSSTMPLPSGSAASASAL